MKKLFVTMLLCVSLLYSQSASAWNGTGHTVVAQIAWDNMTETARTNVVKLMLKAPADSCLRELLPADSRPLAIRHREFFANAANWPDIVRPDGNNDPRPCIRFHERDWHFINYFWSGTSGDPNDPPTDLSKPVAAINAVERLEDFKVFIVSTSTKSKRAMRVAWVIHLVGDIHQPLHTSGRVTTSPNENDGDNGGNDFKLGNGNNALSLHSYWDKTLDRSDPRKQNEKFWAYIDRLSQDLQTSFPRSNFDSGLKAGEIEAWSREGLARAKDEAYPKTLVRRQMPADDYKTNTFRVSKRAIAEAVSGVRLRCGSLLLFEVHDEG